MKKTFNTPTTCSCGNHLLMPEGMVCETCMGLVAAQTTDFDSESPYDVSYFEALEEAVSNFDAVA